MAWEHHLNILAEDLPARHVSCPVGSSPQGIPSFRHWDLLGPQHPRPRYKCGVPDAKLGAQCGMLKVFASKTFEYCAREASQVQLWGSGGWPLGILGRKRMSDLVSSAVSRYSQRILKVQKTPTDEQFCKPPFFYLTFAPKTHNFPPEWPKTKVSSNFSLKNLKQTYITYLTFGALKSRWISLSPAPSGLRWFLPGARWPREVGRAPLPRGARLRYPWRFWRGGNQGWGGWPANKALSWWWLISLIKPKMVDICWYLLDGHVVPFWSP